ncbi:hypothetical protein A3K24_00495 [candidate division Kazan bacterium RIFCSPHIGHO2_01_FULL_44_14]|uniref:Resolvase/invertase-type recombinase catalytic domain-containing protein n=1 Tax=candidate division Kazan bacterium RIFCSPLOWO2_01_FULL_45_19 TaxID=1798538 RepID=A0A1F4NPQ1_UNCK3|nr:MAG: hypothetical protein A3K51_00495 [candidate division Kazan bacterium RIFCSPLOWO2_01_FULL_45_19]OGB77591.1 MAG: hypothetical protein A3K24_00495 [candidate division Kazan bacterium RIFCSPHIGHO2_01_FULL_44_14]
MEVNMAQNEAVLETPEGTREAPQAEVGRYCLYARKSSESDERQALSIDSQIKEMMAIAERDGIEVVETIRESHSAKDSGQRPEFMELLRRIREQEFNGILTWAPDRLSRNAGDLGDLVDMMDQGLLKHIKTPSQIFRNSPNEKFLLMILCSQAKLENDNRGINVKRGMKNKCDMGWMPCLPPLGYLNDKANHTIIVDAERAPFIKEAFNKVAEEGYTGRALWSWFNKETEFTTRAGKKMALSMVHNMLRNHFYYGQFMHGGVMHQGKHEPLITKELFDKVREAMQKGPRGRYGEKMFAFTRMITCGRCELGITAEEKVKKLKNGEGRRHVYYHCSGFGKYRCKEGWMREADLIEQFVELIDGMDINRIGMREKLQEEIERYNRFTTGVLGMNPDTSPIPRVDLKMYAKYILRDGSPEEKREILKNIKNKVVLHDGKLSLQNTPELIEPI